MKRFVILFAVLLLAASPLRAVKIIHGPYLQNVTESEATFVWVSDSVTLGWVEIAPDDGTHFYVTERPQYFDCANGIKNESRIHAVRVRGLKPGTFYRYRVYAKEVTEHRGNYVAYGRTAATDVYTRQPLKFRTLDPAAGDVRFTMINDMHGDVPKLQKLMGYTDLSRTDMVLFVGDMVSFFESEEQVFGGFMDAAVDLFAKETPMYYTRGNHETRGRSAWAFQNYFSPLSDHIYYMYRQGPVCFVALDSGEDKPDSDLEYYGLTMYDDYRDEQVEWLRQVVRSEEFLSAPFKVVTCHIPPFGGWHGNDEVAQKFIPILEEAGVDIMLSAHLHRYVHQPAGESARFPIVVNSNDTILQAVVDGHTMKVEVLGMDGKTVDKFEIKK